MKVVISAEVRPTEDEEKDMKAVLNIFDVRLSE